MPEWVIWGILWYAMFRLFRRRGCWAACGYRGRVHGWDDEWRRRPLRDADEPRSTAPLPQTPLEALQRRYVSGSITLEEYESELDRLYGRKSESVN